MRTIYKYDLEITGIQTLMLPTSFEILSLQVQNDKIQIWAIVETEHLKQPYRFTILGTGFPVDTLYDKESYVGTCQVGIYVWHVFHTYGKP